MSSTQNTKNILILGDWFVDEYWFMAQHHSETSSHTGENHFRIVSEHSDAVKDLSGAGLIARILYELRKYRRPENPSPLIESLNIPEDGTQIDDILKCMPNKNSVEQRNLFYVLAKDYELCGIGIWNDLDTNLIKHFIHAKCTQDFGEAIRASFRLKPKTCSHEIDITLLPLTKADATTRIIRSYRLQDNNFKLISRVDWEPRRKNKSEENPIGERLAFLSRLPDSGELHIIVDDHIKGFVESFIDEKLVEHLKTCYKPKWYVRTKNREVISKTVEPPGWFKAIPEIEFLAVGPDIAMRRHPVECLLTDQNLRRHPYELIKDTLELKAPKINNVIVASDRMEAIIVLNRDDICYALPSQLKGQDMHLDKVNWTTAFFASLCREMIMHNGSIREDNVQEAADNAQKHSGVRKPQSVFYSSLPRPSKSAKSTNREFPAPRNWSEIRQKWGDSMTGNKRGIIEIKVTPVLDKIERVFEIRQASTDLSGYIAEISVHSVFGKIERALEVWRASSDLPGYIACIEEKRQAIGRIWHEMRNFTAGRGATKPLSILLDADPGVGKTFLAERLATALKCNLIHRDITQMIRRDELLDLFDSVATAQAERPGDTVLVFVDEINASLDGSPVYGAFLSPLESSDYMRRQGTKFKLKSCIWMFAGSRIMEGKSGQAEKEKVEKFLDFISRLNMIEEINYGTLRNKAALKDKADFKGKAARLDEEARLEQVYLGAQMINNFFSDVVEIHKELLDKFYQLDPAKAPARNIRNLARFLQNVQYGKVDNRNCTHGYWAQVFREQFGISTTDWRKWVNNLPDPDWYVKLDFGRER